MSVIPFPPMKRPLVAILRGVKPEEADGIVGVLIESGMTAIEIPLNSPEPFRSIEIAVKRAPAGVLVGAGTVLALDDVARLHDVGGRLMVSPNVDAEIIANARARGMVTILADSALTAAEWGADGIYGAPRALYPHRAMLRLATAHNLREIGEANRLGADAVLLSPAFATRSHPGAAALGPLRFRLIAARSRVPVIALGGMDPHRAERLGWPFWAAIDGLS